MTRRLRYAFLCAVIATSNVLAQFSLPSNNAHKLMEMTLPSDQVQDAMLGTILNRAKSRYRNADPSKWSLVTSEMREFMLSKFREPGGFFDQVSQSYQRRFSESELDEIIAFHQTKTGNKWLRERDKALMEVLPFLQKESYRLGPLLDAQLEVIAKNHGM